MLGVTIGEKHSFNDLGLILTSKIISPPTPQTNKIEVPLRDGAIYLNEILTGEVKFKERKITLNFAILDRESWAYRISELQNYLHGKRMKVVFDDDLAFYYIGRISVNKWTSNKNIGSIVIEGEVDPYKYDRLSSAEDWEWDIFDFDQSIINETKEIVANGNVKYSLICRRKIITPIFTTDAAMKMTFEGKTYNLDVGTQKIYDLFLHEGINELDFTGKGTVMIDYTGGSL